MSKNDLPISSNPIKTTLSFCVGEHICKVILKIEGNIIIKIKIKILRKSEFSKKLSRLKTIQTTNVKSKNIAEY